MDILVFEENGSGQAKIRGIGRYGVDENLRVVSIDGALPDFIDDPEEYLDGRIEADLVISYLNHPDLVDHLARLCGRLGIPLIASGKKGEQAHTPFTCCGLGLHPSLGSYGRRFGFPEYRVELEGDRITALEVIRGAPCGATWEVVAEVIGSTVDEALVLLPRLIQYHCTANPSRFDPVTGKSPVHYAGHVHRAALNKGVTRFRDQVSRS